MTWKPVEVRRDRLFHWSVWFGDRYVGYRRTRWGADRLAGDVVDTLKREGYESLL